MKSPSDICSDLLSLQQKAGELLAQGQDCPQVLELLCQELTLGLSLKGVHWFNFEPVTASYVYQVAPPAEEALDTYCWPGPEPATVVLLCCDDAPCLGGIILLGELKASFLSEFERFAKQLSLLLFLHQERSLMRRQLENERLLTRITQQIGKTFDIEQILNSTASEIVRHLQVSRSLIYRFRLDVLDSPVHSVGQAVLDSSERFIAFEDFPLQAIRQRIENMVFQTGTAEEPVFPDVEAVCLKYDIQSLVRVYIVYRGIPLGMMMIHQTGFARQWQASEIQLLERIGELLGAALYQADLYYNEQQAKEAARAANLRKNQFIASLTHDLRTPLQNILGGSALLQTQMLGPLNEKQSGYIDRINKSGEHLLRMIDDMLDIARIEAGRFSITYEAMDVRGWLEQAVAVMDPSFRKKEQAVTLIFADNLPQWIQGDIRRLSQVMDNLLSNASKFSPDGSSIRVLAKVDSEYLLVSIEDDGAGIAPGDLDIIFNPFERGGQAMVSKKEGTGLGLTIAKTIIELHHGSIQVASELAKGSVFTLRLPLRPICLTEQAEDNFL